MHILLYRLLLFGLFMPAWLPSGKPVIKKPHPLHVSTADISFNKEDSKMEVICKIFTDDFELALNKQFNKKIDLQKPEMHDAMDVLMKNYIGMNLHVKSNGVSLPLNYLGFEVAKEYTNIYLESEKTAVPRKIDAEASLLYNLFTDQINIVHMTVNGTRKSGRVDYPEKNIGQSF